MKRPRNRLNVVSAKGPEKIKASKLKRINYELMRNNHV